MEARRGTVCKRMPGGMQCHRYQPSTNLLGRVGIPHLPGSMRTLPVRVSAAHHAATARSPSPAAEGLQGLAGADRTTAKPVSTPGWQPAPHASDLACCRCDGVEHGSAGTAAMAGQVTMPPGTVAALTGVTHLSQHVGLAQADSKGAQPRGDMGCLVEQPLQGHVTCDLGQGIPATCSTEASL